MQSLILQNSIIFHWKISFKKMPRVKNEEGAGFQPISSKIDPPRPLISTSHNLQFPCSFPFCCLITFIAVQHTTNNKKHAHTSNKRYILAREQKKETDEIIIILSASYHDK